MANQTVKIQGKLLNKNRQPLFNLRVEAWDTDVFTWKDFVGEAVSDRNGDFEITFTQSRYKEWIFDRKPDIYFKIYDDGELVAETKDNVLWNIESDLNELEIIVDVEAEEDDSEVCFQIPITGRHIRPVTLDETSMRINLLHKVLKLFGFPVSAEEEKSHTAGESTLKQMRKLQAKLHIKYDEKYVVDQATYDCLREAITKAGFSDKSQTFVVKGTVYDRNGEPVKRQKLIALDVDLRGAAVYRTLETIKDAQTNGGFEFLCQGCSDLKGSYYFEFFNFQFERAERAKADIIVYAIDKNGEISGRSRLLNSEDYSDTREVIDLDVLITKDEDGTEYEILIGKLAPFLKENAVELVELADSNEQVIFTSRELDENQSKIQAAVDAESLRNGKKNKCENLSHELLYGIGRQNIALDWSVLFKKTGGELKSALEKSVTEKIIGKYDEGEIDEFLESIHRCATAYTLREKDENQNVSLEEKLSAALPKTEQREAFVNAYRNFKSQIPENEQIDYRKFWDEYLPEITEFKENPALIASLKLNQQLHIISGSHQPLIKELQVKRRVSSVAQLLALEKDEWKEIIQTAGVPEFVAGKDEEEKIAEYAVQIQASLNAAFPTQKIALMLKNEKLPVKDADTANGVNKFLSASESFDFSTSKIHKSEDEIRAAAPNNFEAVKSELKRMQRVFQVSPTPEIMGVLMQKNLNSAYAIANIPKKNFIEIYGADLGGALNAEAVYQRAEHINALTAERTMLLYEFGNAATPAFAYSADERETILKTIEKELPDHSGNKNGRAEASMRAEAEIRKLPNYSELFGSPDMCECKHCRSVCSAASYFVELLRFLSTSRKNAARESPLDVFAARRPDLLHLPLTCENTNTNIPYIDLVNEVMEYYTCHSTLDSAAAYDTGEATADELRANPQNLKPEAYEILNSAFYPFSLPYHQPLDVIRTYSEHLKTERYEVMKAMQNDDSSPALKAIEAEALRISEEEYRILTRSDFSSRDDLDESNPAAPEPLRQIQQYFGFPFTDRADIAAANMEEVAGVGVDDGIHEFLRRSGMKYVDLVELIKTRFINPLPDDSAITLYQSNSSCDLNTTYLRTLANVRAGASASGITEQRWSKIHRFIRLWRKLGWKIREVDLMLSALGENDITRATISKLSGAVLLNKHLKLPINQLATFWGNIDFYGDESLYKKLFLNKAVQKIDEAFKPDAHGNYLTDSSQVLQNHIPAILAAFRMSEDDLKAIAETAGINLAGGELNIYNLSVIYRYTVLSKALKLKVPDLCLLIKLFNKIPFSTLSVTADPRDEPFFENVSPAATLKFYQLAESIKKSGFKTDALQYIFAATLPAESKIGLDEEKTTQAVSDIRKAFAAIEQNHPSILPTPITAGILSDKLSIFFKEDVISRLIDIIENREPFDIITDAGLEVEIPDAVSSKFKYTKTSGRFSCIGVMSDAEKTLLKTLPGANENFQNAVDAIYRMPADFIADNFGDVFANVSSDLINSNLLNRPPAELEEKLQFVYDKYLPLLKQKLREDAIIQHLATLIGLSQEAALILTKNDLPQLIEDASPTGAIARFIETVRKYYRASKFINGFKLTDTEVNHFVKYRADFGNIDFKALTPTNWQRINDYVQLRNAVPQSQALLTDVFAAANAAAPAPAMENLTGVLYLATGWNINALTFLTNHFSLSTADFKNEIKLKKIYDAVLFVSKTGLSAETLAGWADTAADFEALNTTAGLVKNTVKAKYEEADWLKLAGDLSDKIRENQKQALISYLLTKPEFIDRGIKDADGLFEYFLIDVQMGACMNTSRIVQANAAVQMFVNRCFLNLEKQVSPDVIDKERWGWMKNYRVWEVNRKTFLYPENWLEPEWRDDRSSFFKELESELTQNDITDRSVETAFRNYLAKLNTVANLDICGVYQENYDDGKMKTLHVFGRTHNAPYQFFYRTCSEFYKWSAWEKVQVDIRMTEDGDNSGVHLLPVVWKNRLFIFWAEFTEKQKERVLTTKGGTDENIRELAEHPPSLLRTPKYWEIKLAWSELVEGKWNPKQLSKEASIIDPDEFPELPHYLTDQPVKFILRSKITNQDLRIIPYISDTHSRKWIACRHFSLLDIQSKVLIIPTDPRLDEDMSGVSYYANFQKHNAGSKLELWDNFYLERAMNYNLIFSNSELEKEKTPDAPFFYHLPYTATTYFVRPINSQARFLLRNPEFYAPALITATIHKILVAGNLVKSGKFEEKSNSFPRRIATRRAASDIMASRGNIVWELANNNELLPTANVGIAFSDPVATRPSFGSPLLYVETKLEFHTFHHPYSGQFVTNLNRYGIKGLMESDTNLSYNDNGAHFGFYAPNRELVIQAPPLNDYKPGERYTYYKENICFDVYGANSIYNWELFFHAPLYIATRLSKNGKFEEAMKWFHYIFDPTTSEAPLPGQSETSRYWKTLPFKTTPAERLEEWFEELRPVRDSSDENEVIAEWRRNPFNPFVVARNRPLAFMKNVVIKYVENLRAWGDSLFRQFNRESVNEALQLYVIANHILGPRPVFVPRRGKIKAETYKSLKEKWDSFSNALVEMENIFPYSSSVAVSTGSSIPGLMGIGRALYFCIPPNESLMEHWDTVADRLYKIRHCMDIDGVERQLALFSPPIDPAMLINAAAQGLSLGSILSDLSSPPPIYRFNYLIQKANEFCGEVKSLGGALLSALEKRDGEELGRLRASHEAAMLELMTAIKERQVLDAKANKEILLKSRETAKFRLEHYNALLSPEPPTIPNVQEIEAEVNSETRLPETSIARIETDVDVSLVDSNEAGIKLIPRERQEIELNKLVADNQFKAMCADVLAGFLGMIPQFDAKASPLGVGAGTGFGGRQLSWFAASMSKGFSTQASILSLNASQSGRIASYIRREQDWTLQANLAAKEIIQLDKQITSADIKIQLAEKELSNHKRQIDNSKQVEQFLKDKFTNQEMYQWLREQLFSVYKQSYNMAYEMAKKAEKCYRYELGNEVTSFIQYGYWDNMMQGLCAGEKLQLALRQMEKSYLEENKRELELSKNVSMALLNPLALQELRTSGECHLAIPEELFDLDYQGHYFRRIKSVSISLPCISGPYTTISCSLRLVQNAVRTNTSMNEDGDYEHNNDEGVWIDDDRFRESLVPVKAIAASSGQRDSGMFEFNFRDERYLPFEGAGAVSVWKIELNKDADLRQFDYSTISDLILHINYTAREDVGSFKRDVVAHLKNFLVNASRSETQPLLRMFSVKHEFSTEWHKFLTSVSADAEPVLSLKLIRDHFPFFTRNRSIIVRKIEILMKANREREYRITLAGTSADGADTIQFDETTMTENAVYNYMQTATLAASDADIAELNVFNPLTLTLSEREEISELFVVFHYALGEPV